MKKLAFLSLILSISLQLLAQKTKQIKEGDKWNYSEYSVLKDNKKVKHGHFKQVVNKRIVAEGNFDNGKKVGTWNYSQGKNSFKEVTYGESETRIKEQYGDFVKEYTSAAYNDDILDGEYKDLINGELNTEGFYKNGVKDGLWKFYNNGIKYFETEYSSNVPVKDRVFKYDTLISTVTYKNGLKEGEVISSFGNGKPHFVNYYKKDKLSGTSIRYNRKGQILSKTEYFEGRKNGLRELYDNNTLINQAQYTNDTLNGVLKAYYSNANLMHEMTFEMGKPKEVIKAFTKNGEVDQNCNLKNGTGRVVQYFMDGSIAKDLNFKNGEFHFKQITYHSNGEIALIENYNNGIANGLAEKRNEAGDLVFKGKVENGFKVGEWIEWSYASSKTEEKAYSLENEVKYSTDSDIGSISNSSPVHSVVEEMPEYPSGMTGLMNFLRTHISYPEMERNNNIEGISYVKFVVDERGYITDIGIYEGTESKATTKMHEESIRVVSKMPRWKPGFQKGVSVKVSYIIPIRYKLR